MADYETPLRHSVVPHIVCAAMRYKDILIVGARHYDTVMREQLKAYFPHGDYPRFDQGFIDQWGRFYERVEAHQLVTSNGQKLTTEPLHRILFSENLY